MTLDRSSQPPTTYIRQLTDAQNAAIPAHVARWIDVGHCTDEADWDTFQRAAADCYAHAGLPWHGNVVRLPNPLALSLAAPIAAYLLDRHSAVAGAVAGAVDAVVVAVVHGAVDGAVDGAVAAAVHGAVAGAVHGAVAAAVHGAVDAAVHGAVDAAVHGAVDAAVHGAVLRDHITRYYAHRLGGQWWIPWQARTSFYREVCGLQLDGDLWDRDRAYAAAQSSAGWWWPHRRFVMVCDRPAELHLEQIAPTGWGSHRLHRADGPAIRWRDGYGLHFWHGTHVPADLIDGAGWTTDRILREPNAEIRRCAIERLGWDTFVNQGGFAQVGQPVPDPGNPGADLALYDVPTAIYDEPVRVLLARNGTPERDGTYRRFGMTVPASISDPVAAAAWGYDDPSSPVRVTPDLYAQIPRRT